MTLLETVDYTAADEQAFRYLSFKWSIAWDKKDISTWLDIAAPEIVADYTDYPAVGVLKQGDSEAFFKASFSNAGLGNNRLEVQHLLGAAAFTRISDVEAKGDWQVRARHVRNFPDGRVAEWDSSAFCEFRYVKIDGTWKIGGLRPHSVVATTGRPEEVIGNF